MPLPVWNLFARPPGRAELFAWLSLTDTGTAGDVYDLALQTALDGQAAVCDVSRYTAGLHAAAMRRAARFLTARGLTLGASDAGEWGQLMIPRWDAEIEAYERPYRIGAFA